MSIFTRKRKVIIVDQHSCFREVTVQREKEKAEGMSKFRDAVNSIVCAVKPDPACKKFHIDHEW